MSRISLLISSIIRCKLRRLQIVPTSFQLIAGLV